MSRLQDVVYGSCGFDRFTVLLVVLVVLLAWDLRSALEYLLKWDD
jgi:hypothetical protein